MLCTRDAQLHSWYVGKHHIRGPSISLTVCIGGSGCYPKIPFLIVLISCNSLSHWWEHRVKVLGLCHFQDQGETTTGLFFHKTEAITSYRSVSPELLELLTGTSIQLAFNKGQEQQSLTPSSLGEPRSNHNQWMYYERKQLVLRD